MQEKISFVRLAWLLLALFFIGKLIVGFAGGSYELGNRLFAMVPLTVHLCLVWGAIAKAYRGEGAGSAFMTGATIAVFAQVLVFSGTMLYYLFGIETHFSEPVAIVGEAREVGMSEALVGRAGGLVANTIVGGIAAVIGWSLAFLLPAKR